MASFLTTSIVIQFPRSLHLLSSASERVIIFIENKGRTKLLRDLILLDGILKDGLSKCILTVLSIYIF